MTETITAPLPVGTTIAAPRGGSVPDPARTESALAVSRTVTTLAVSRSETTFGLALQRAAEVLRDLPAADIAAFAAGRGELVFRRAADPRPADTADPDSAHPDTARPDSAPPLPRRRPGPNSVDAADVAAAVRAINAMTAPDEVAAYLARRRFAQPVLKEIARALGPTVLSTGRTRGDLERNIVQGTAGFRVRSAAMSGGAWL